MLDIAALTILGLLGWGVLLAGLAALRLLLWVVVLPLALLWLAVRPQVRGLAGDPRLAAGVVGVLGLCLAAWLAVLPIPLLSLLVVALGVRLAVRLSREAPTPTRA